MKYNNLQQCPISLVGRSPTRVMGQSEEQVNAGLNPLIIDWLKNEHNNNPIQSCLCEIIHHNHHSPDPWPVFHNAFKLHSTLRHLPRDTFTELYLQQLTLTIFSPAVQVHYEISVLCSHVSLYWVPVPLWTAPLHPHSFLLSNWVWWPYITALYFPVSTWAAG